MHYININNNVNILSDIIVPGFWYDPVRILLDLELELASHHHIGVGPVRYKTNSVQRADDFGTGPLRYIDKHMP